MKLQKDHIIFCIIGFLVFNCSKNNDDDNTETDSKAQIQFVKALGGSLNESAQSVVKTSDGGYVVLGYTQSNDEDITNKSNESFDYWLLKFDSTDNLQWQQNYGGSDDDRGSDIIQTSDGGYAIIGLSQSSDDDVTENAGASDFWITKLDTSGNILWEKSFGFSGADTGLSIIQTNDSGYLLTGVLDVTASGGEGNSKTVSTQKHAGGDYWAIKLSASGDKEWSRYYGGSFTDTPYDVLQTSDNGYVIVGSSDSDDVDISGNKGSYDFWIIKISDIGTLVWEKSFGGSEIDEARGIIESDDGNYLVVGDTRSSDSDVSNNKGAADIWLIKISPSGDLIWEKSFGGTNFDSAQSISNTLDGGFLISGNSRSSNGNLNKNNGQNDAWVFKIDANANIEWQNTIGGSDFDFAYDATELDDGTIIVVGESNSNNLDIPENKGFTDLLIFKMN